MGGPQSKVNCEMGLSLWVLVWDEVSTRYSIYLTRLAKKFPSLLHILCSEAEGYQSAATIARVFNLNSTALYYNVVSCFHEEDGVDDIDQGQREWELEGIKPCFFYKAYHLQKYGSIALGRFMLLW